MKTTPLEPLIQPTGPAEAWRLLLEAMEQAIEAEFRDKWDLIQRARTASRQVISLHLSTPDTDKEEPVEVPDATSADPVEEFEGLDRIRRSGALAALRDLGIALPEDPTRLAAHLRQASEETTPGIDPLTGLAAALAGRLASSPDDLVARIADLLGQLVRELTEDDDHG
jgi:hypothetical protein